MPYGFNEDKSKFDLTKIIEATTMLASGWNSKAYSFESTYPSDTYDIEIEPNGDSATSDHLDAWNAAKIVGSATTNTIKALGDVPTVNIPIIIKAVKK